MWKYHYYYFYYWQKWESWGRKLNVGSFFLHFLHFVLLRNRWMFEMIWVGSDSMKKTLAQLLSKNNLVPKVKCKADRCHAPLAVGSLQETFRLVWVVWAHVDQSYSTKCKDSENLHVNSQSCESDTWRSLRYLYVQVKVALLFERENQRRWSFTGSQ